MKATLIMIPLLGVNNLLFLVRPDMNRVGIFVWKIISAFLVAFQVVCVWRVCVCVCVVFVGVCVVFVGVCLCV